MADVVIGLIITAVVIKIIHKMIRDKKAGKSGCGCNCQGCGMNGSCHKAHKINGLLDKEVQDGDWP